jgi:hypothetical protein
MLHHPDDPEHTARCEECQARAGVEALDVDLERAWLGVAAEIWATQPGPVERLAGRLLGSPGLARALVTTPSLVLSWLVATAVVLAVGALATWGTGTPWTALLAPALAGIGIAYAYGPGIDPAFELGQTMAISDRTILLVRGLAVFGVNAALGLVASFVTADAATNGLTLGWLVPMTTVAALALAAATLARSANVGVAVGLAIWGLVVLAGFARTGDMAAAVDQAAWSPVYLLITVAGFATALWATSGQRKEVIGWE